VGHFWDTYKNTDNTMKDFKYQLAKRGKMFCPQCGKRTFVPYVDASGEILDETVGKCDRADKCAYHYPPRQFFADKGMTIDAKRRTMSRPMPLKPVTPSYIEADVLKQTLALGEYGRNNLVLFLIKTFGEVLAREMVERYYIGTSRHWGGSTVFWQVDRNGRIHTGKVMQYDASTGKRVKKPFNHVTWVHTVMKLQDYHLRQCLFGEHLLNTDKQKPVLVLESEKSAIIFSAVRPDYIAVACGGCGNLSASICAPLRGRDVVLCPDNGKYQEWSDKARDLRHLCKSIRVSAYMEQHAQQQGDDIADVIVPFFEDYQRIKGTPP